MCSSTCVCGVFPKTINPGEGNYGWQHPVSWGRKGKGKLHLEATFYLFPGGHGVSCSALCPLAACLH